MTSAESTYTFDLMNLRFEFFQKPYKGEETWYLRVFDRDATEAGVAGLEVEQRLDQSYESLRLMALMAGMLLAQEEHGSGGAPTNQALDPK